MLPGPHSIRVLKISSVNLDSMPSFEAYGRLVAISFESAFWFRNDNFVRYSDADLSELLVVVPRYKSLEGLNLHRSPVKDQELVYLAAMTNLRNLDLSDTGITNEGLVHIAQIKSLRFPT